MNREWIGMLGLDVKTKKKKTPHCQKILPLPPAS